MTLGELIALYRQQADDQTSHPLWRDDELLRWANDAEVEACRRARLIVDSRSVTQGTGTATTDGICRITLGSGVEFYDLDPRIIYLRRVKLASRTIPLESFDYRDLDCTSPGWESHTGNVTGYVRGLDSGKFRPYKIPNGTDTVNLLVVREPLEPMEDPNDKPEINPRYHRNLVDWMLFKGYSRMEAQTYDPELAAKHLALFEAEFGTRNKAAALEEEWARNNLPFNEMD